MSNEVVTVDRQEQRPAQSRQRIEVQDAIPVLDTGRFEHMQRIASAMAGSSLIPDSLRKIKEGNEEKWLDHGEVVANCFLIVNQAVRWGLDPFAVASCVSVVHGKLCYEGKLIAAVLEAKLGVHLDYEWNSERGDNFGIVVSGVLPDGQVKSIEGTVGEWKTTGAGSPWGKMARKMLAYRGAREWARLYAPGIMLGVYGDDEMESMAEEARARRAQPVGTGLAERLSGGGNGFNAKQIGQTLAKPETDAEVATDKPEQGKELEADERPAEPERAASQLDDFPGDLTNDDGDVLEAEREGRRAFHAGEPRTAPDDFTNSEKTAWLMAWDAEADALEAAAQ